MEEGNSLQSCPFYFHMNDIFLSQTTISNCIYRYLSVCVDIVQIHISSIVLLDLLQVNVKMFPDMFDIKKIMN